MELLRPIEKMDLNFEKELLHIKELFSDTETIKNIIGDDCELNNKAIVEDIEISLLMLGTQPSMMKSINSYEDYKDLLEPYDFLAMDRPYGVLKSLANEPAIWTSTLGKMGFFTLTMLNCFLVKDISSIQLTNEYYITSITEVEDKYKGVLNYLGDNIEVIEYLMLVINVNTFIKALSYLCAYHNVDISQLPTLIDDKIDALLEMKLSDYVLDEDELTFIEDLYNDMENTLLLEELIGLGHVMVNTNGLPYPIDEDPTLEPLNFNSVDDWLGAMRLKYLVEEPSSVEATELDLEEDMLRRIERDSSSIVEINKTLSLFHLDLSIFADAEKLKHILYNRVNRETHLNLRDEEIISLAHHVYTTVEGKTSKFIKVLMLIISNSTKI